MTKHDNVSQGKIMKATEFVKWFGLESAERVVNAAPEGGASYNFNIKKYSDGMILKGISWVRVDHLKHLVESHELVKEHGSLERAKMYAESIYTAPEVVVRLKQAIADVEACQ